MNKSIHIFFLAFIVTIHGSITLSMERWNGETYNGKPLITVNWGEKKDQSNKPHHDSHDHAMKQAHDSAIKEHLHKGIGPKSSSSKEYDYSTDDNDDGNDYDDDDDYDDYYEEHLAYEARRQREIEATEKYYEENNIPYLENSDGTKTYFPPLLNTYGNDGSMHTTVQSNESQKPVQQKIESTAFSPSLTNIYSTHLQGNQTATTNTSSSDSIDNSSSQQIEIDESEFESYSSPAATNIPKSISNSPKVSNPTRQINRKSLPARSRKNNDTPESSFGLDNNPWPDHLLEEQRAQRKAARDEKKRSRRMIDLLVNDQSIPSHVRDALHDIVKADGYWGWITPDEMQRRIQPIRQDYKNILHHLRIQENLTAEQIEQRRALEDELFTQEERTLVYEGALKQIDRKRQRDIDENINILHIFTSKLQQLNNKYDARKSEYKRNALDALSEGYKKEYQDKQRQKEEELKKFQDEALQRQNQLEHQRHVQKINKARKEIDRIFREQKPKPLEEHPSNSSDAFLTFADIEIIIEPEQRDPTINLDGIDLSSVDFVVTTQSNEFLKQIGIDPNEFNNFKGNAKQNKLHKKLSKAIKNASDLGIEVAPHVREMQQELFKAAYDLNTQSYTEIAQDLLELCNPCTLGLALGKEVADTVLYPLEYIKRRLNEMPGIAKSHLPLIERYERMQAAAKDIAQTTQELNAQNSFASQAKNIEKNNKQLSIQERQQMLAQNTIDFFVDFLLIAGAGKTFEVSGLNKAHNNYRMRNYYRKKYPYYDITIEAFDNPRPSPVSPTTLIEGAADGQLPAVVENAVNQVIKAIEQKSMPIRSSEPIVVHPEAPTHTLPEAAVTEKGLAEVLADVGEKEASNNIIHYMEPESRTLKVVDNEVLRNTRSGSALKPCQRNVKSSGI